METGITPLPPVADVALPWDRTLDDPVATLADARRRFGDTFVVDGPRHPTLFLFSPAGVRSFYALPEAEASKGVADWMMLTRKLPDELFSGRRTFPAELFGREDVAAYLAQLRAAISVAFDELGDAGEVDLFAFTRRLGHRMGLACWAGEVPSRAARFDALVAAFDALDGSDAFVHPEEMARVAAAGKREERAALAVVEDLLVESIRARDAAPPQDDLFARIVGRWDGEPEPDRSVGIARDVVLVHLGSMSNLFAATGWMLAQLATHPDVLARVRAGEDGLLERCALESTRLGQRSIMLRAVLAPTTVRDEHAAYSVPVGAQIATLLPLTNTTAMPGLAGYDPDRWVRRRLRDDALLPARELVTTFGHGAHTCPAQPFSLAAMCLSAESLFTAYDVSARFTDVQPLPVQIGGVARAAAPCVVEYRRR
ncbi:MAG: cytochrome P450 [Actinobacteria bacterium]|nr:cytochrome P450 [Actinomycetota bacterium]